MFFSVFVNDMFANLGEMVYLLLIYFNGNQFVNTLVSMLCAISPLKGECCAGVSWRLVAGAQ